MLARLGSLHGQHGHPGGRTRSPETKIGAGKAVALTIVLLLIENSWWWELGGCICNKQDELLIKEEENQVL